MPEATFLRVLSDEDKEVGLQRAIQQANQSGGDKTFTAEPSSFLALPSCPLAYWVDPLVAGLFQSMEPLESDGRTVKRGMGTGDARRFVRCWWEVYPSKLLDVDVLSLDQSYDYNVDQDQIRQCTYGGTPWAPYAKIDKAMPFDVSPYLVVNWRDDGRELKASSKSYIRNEDLYFRPGIAFPRRSARFYAHIFPMGSIISDRGSGIYNSSNNIYADAGFLSSKAFNVVLSTLLARSDWPQYDVGTVAQTPVCYSKEQAKRIAEISHRCYGIMCKINSVITNNRAFNIEEIFGIDIKKYLDTEFAMLQSSHEELNALIREIYGLSSNAVSDSERDLYTELGRYFANELAGEKVEALIGIAFGRVYYPRLNSTGDIGVPANAFGPVNHTLQCVQNSGIMVEDESQSLDIAQVLYGILQALFGKQWEDNLDLINEELPCSSLREYLYGCTGISYSNRHIQKYSKGSRKAPIYWRISIPSSGYSVWLYYHRFHKDTLFKVLSEHLVPKLQAEERKLDMLLRDYGPKPTTGQSEEISEQEDFVEELRWMREELEMVAPLWEPDLDDGVELNFAPLWRLVPQNRSWQKHLKKRWDELCSGKYDWSLIAMRLWPERAVQACLQDRSYAIAHGLEDELWVEGESGWQVRDLSEEDIERIISERSSKPVQDALERLLSAPPPMRRGRGGGKKRG